MIDFRYHIVSLVAVFLALAVGIALGAGPLREELGTTLEGQVSELRDERNLLRAELDDALARNEARDDLVAILAPVATDDRLAGIRVALVLMPGADRNLVETVSDSVDGAGGEVVSTTTLLAPAEDPEQAATRHEAALELAALLAEPAPREGSDPTLATVLAAALAGLDEEGEVGQWRAAELRLEELGLVEFDRNDDVADSESVPGAPDRRPADAVVVLTGGLTEGTVQDEDGGDDRLTARVDLVAALGAVEMPTVVLAAGAEQFQNPDDQLEDALIQAVRGDGELAETVSTVDNGESATGQVALVLALGQALQGEFGQWGVGAGAEGVAPMVPPALEPEDGSTPTGPVLDPPVVTEGPTGQGGSPTPTDPVSATATP